MNNLIAILLVLSWATTANRLSAQSGTSVPLRPNEQWMAAGVLNEGGTQWKEVAFEASPGKRFGISLRRVTGGFEEDEGLEAWSARIGAPFSIGAARFCLFGGFELNDFSFVNRFEVDRGEAKYLAREVGLRADVPISTLKGAELSAWVAPAVTSLKIEVSGRTLIADDQVFTEERNFGGTEWRFSGQAGLTLRWKSLGISGGITKRPALSSGTLAFVRVGVAVSRGGSHSPGST